MCGRVQKVVDGEPLLCGFRRRYGESEAQRAVFIANAGRFFAGLLQPFGRGHQLDAAIGEPHSEPQGRPVVGANHPFEGVHKFCGQNGAGSVLRPGTKRQAIHGELIGRSCLLLSREDCPPRRRRIA